jgi:putative cardiolipin synthase
MDPVLAELSSHRNIDVRLFNPFWSRRWRLLCYLTDFSRLNRRMHNKSFTTDDQVTIIGGRNVGDEYFGVGDEVQFIDLDVMAIGDVVHDVTQDFNRYWSYASARPIERLLRTGAGTRRKIRPDTAHTKKQAERFLEAVSADPFIREMLEGRLSFEWASVHMVSDDPSKVRGRVRDAELLWTRLTRMLKEPAEELQLVSAYFVPGKQGVDHFAGMAQGGVRVTVLTNSLEATDVAAVHAGYAKRRKPLLKAGITLFELKRMAGSSTPRRRGRGGSSDSSLHAKTSAIDRSVAFVGSFNFDPRSLRLNTELAFVIESPALATALADQVIGTLADQSYRVRLGPGGRLQWVDRVEGQEVVHDREPGASLWRRLIVAVLTVLPIEWLL